MKTSTYLAVMVLALIWSSDFLYDLSACPTSEEVLMNVSAYCPGACCCGEFADGRTANDYEIQEGDHFVAADKRFAFGTKMIIPGYFGGKVVEVKDRGGAIKGNCLDLFFHDHQAALEWGRQQLYVRIINDADH
jgi:3D (Asp-Asp-Asp) domain-containing protein